MNKEFKYMYTLVKEIINDENIGFKIVDKDGFEWSKASSPKGALFGALAVGINLRDIEINTFVPDFGQVLARANG